MTHSTDKHFAEIPIAIKLNMFGERNKCIHFATMQSKSDNNVKLLYTSNHSFYILCYIKNLKNEI